MLKFLIPTTLFICVGNAYATTGNELKDWMNEWEGMANSRPGANSYKAGLYHGYVLSIAETSQGAVWCTRSGITQGQVLAVSSKYLNDNPEKLHQDANALILEALPKAFPCKK